MQLFFSEKKKFLLRTWFQRKCGEKLLPQIKSSCNWKICFGFLLQRYICLVFFDDWRFSTARTEHRANHSAKDGPPQGLQKVRTKFWEVLPLYATILTVSRFSPRSLPAISRESQDTTLCAHTRSLFRRKNLRNERRRMSFYDLANFTQLDIKQNLWICLSSIPSKKQRCFQIAPGYDF